MQLHARARLRGANVMHGDGEIDARAQWVRGRARPGSAPCWKISNRRPAPDEARQGSCAAAIPRRHQPLHRVFARSACATSVLERGEHKTTGEWDNVAQTAVSYFKSMWDSGPSAAQSCNVGSALDVLRPEGRRSLHKELYGGMSASGAPYPHPPPGLAVVGTTTTPIVKPAVRSTRTSDHRRCALQLGHEVWSRRTARCELPGSFPRPATPPGGAADEHVQPSRGSSRARRGSASRLQLSADGKGGLRSQSARSTAA